MRLAIAVGAISTGTLRPDDLLETFGNYLKQLAENEITNMHGVVPPDAEERHMKLVGLAAGDEGVVADEDKSEIISELQDAINEYAPPYLSFGAAEGDGACFGWWPSEPEIEADIADGNAIKVSGLAEVPTDWLGNVIVVNDHGNMKVFIPRVSYEQVWSCV